MANTATLNLERAHYSDINSPYYLERVEDDRIENANIDKVDAHAAVMLRASASFAAMSGSAGTRVTALEVASSSFAVMSGSAASRLEAIEAFDVKANLFTYVSASYNAEAGDIIRVIGQLKTTDAVNVAVATPLFIETFAPSAGSGTIAVISGTQEIAIIDPDGKINTSLVTSTAAGVFVIDVSDLVAESVSLKITPNNGVALVKKLTFAS